MAGFVVHLDGGRVIGGWDDAEPVNESRPRLRRAGDVTVGVVDTGVVLDRKGRPHPWFGRDHLSYCAADDEDVPAAGGGGHESADGHGTFVAGLILREAPTARVRMWGVLDRDRVPSRPDGPTDDDDLAVATAIRALALNRNVRVINLSFDGGTWGEQNAPKLIGDALHDLHELRPDVVVVAAAGNEASDHKVWPAGFEHVVAVGAVDEHSPFTGDAPPYATFTNSGGWIDAYANGVKVLGPYPEVDKPNGWARWSGTSFAAATVSGRIAQVAIEQSVTGAQAWEYVRSHSVLLEDTKARWVRGVDSPHVVTG